MTGLAWSALFLYRPLDQESYRLHIIVLNEEDLPPRSRPIPLSGEQGTGTIETFRLESGGYQSTGLFSVPQIMVPPGLPGLELNLAEIFP